MMTPRASMWARGIFAMLDIVQKWLAQTLMEELYLATLRQMG